MDRSETGPEESSQVSDVTAPTDSANTETVTAADAVTESTVPSTVTSDLSQDSGVPDVPLESIVVIPHNGNH